MRFELKLARRTRHSDDSAAVNQALRDELDIQRTMSIYCHAIDYGHPQLWAQCFNEDGIYRAHLPTGETREITGRAALVAYAAAHHGPPSRYPKHLNWAPVIEIDGDFASARGMFAVLNQTPSGPVLEMYGRYDDELQRGRDLVWRFASRTTTVEAIITAAGGSASETTNVES